MTINNCSQTSQWQQRRKTIFIFNPYKHENITMIFLIVRALRVSNLWCCLVANLKGLAMSKYYPINPAVPEKKPNAPKQCPWTSLNERNNAGGTPEHENSHKGNSSIKMNYLRLPWKAFLDGECKSGLESELMAILPIPASMASLSSLSLCFWSEIAVSATGLWLEEGNDGSKRRGPALIHGCSRHWPAVGRFSGTKSRMGIKKSLKSFASFSLKSYFSMRTLFKGQNRNRRMCLKSPYLLKKSRE